MAEYELDAVNYLPSEVATITNYPEIGEFQEEIALVYIYADQVNTAIDDFLNGRADRINLNAEDLVQIIELCRTICAVLGRADTKCFDVLLNLRKCLQAMQQALYLRNKYGTKYVGTPTAGGVI